MIKYGVAGGDPTISRPPLRIEALRDELAGPDRLQRWSESSERVYADRCSTLNEMDRSFVESSGHLVQGRGLP